MHNIPSEYMVHVKSTRLVKKKKNKEEEASIDYLASRRILMKSKLMLCANIFFNSQALMASVKNQYVFVLYL